MAFQYFSPSATTDKYLWFSDTPFPMHADTRSGALQIFIILIMQYHVSSSFSEPDKHMKAGSGMRKRYFP